MKNCINYKKDDLANVSAIRIETEKMDNYFEKKAVRVSERFLHSAALLPENEVLGWQMSFAQDKTGIGYMFSSSGIKVTSEDYSWIFNDYGKADNDRVAEVRDPFEAGRKVYALVSVLGSAKDVSIIRKKENNMYYDECVSDYDYLDSPKSDSCFLEMYKMLMDMDPIIRFTAGFSEDKTKGHGMILISLSEEMTLRMRTIISVAIPHVGVKEIEKSVDLMDDMLLPDEFFLDSMTGFLCAMAGKNGVEPHIEDVLDEFEGFADEDVCDEDFEEAQNEDFTSIESLELSVRSYNCLKRAGILSVEKLRTMSDEDLMHVRNLGRKCIDEIKQRLASIKEDAVIVSLVETSYMDKLDELIGLEDVKEQVRKISAFAKMKKDMEASSNKSLSMTMNMEFVGNPGTAKTTVARIIAGIFNEIGLLCSNELVEVGRADLVAKYEGQTASKVKEVFRRAKGKVLFIDEAYSLVENWEGAYGDEAIDTIVQEMENNREDIIVIFAGYPDKMKDFFSRNPGLRSRVPFSISFKDYSAEDMLKITEREASKRGLSISKEAKDKVLSICESAVGAPESGNGRFCRNLVENAVLGYASRVYGNTAGSIEKDLCLAEEDFIYSETRTDNKKNPIGFRI